MTKPSELAAVHADVAAAAAKLKADQRIADCLEAVKRDADLTLKDQIALTEIESPPRPRQPARPSLPRLIRR